MYGWVKEPYSWRPPLRVRGNQILLEKKNAEYLHGNKETRSQVWMVQTLRWTGASGWEAKSVSNVALVKRRCIWSRNRKLILRRGFEGRISVIGHLVEVESANILRRGRGKREARITRDGRRKYIYIYGFFCAPIAKKKMRQFCGLFYRLFLLKRTKRGASAPEQQLFIKPTFLVQVWICARACAAWDQSPLT